MERVKRAKEEPLLDGRFPHPYREVIKKLEDTTTLLNKLLEALLRPAAAIRIPGQYPPAQPGDYVNVVANGLNVFGGLRMAQDLLVETVDLSTARATSTIQEFEKLSGIALTVFSSTGTFDLYLNEKNAEHKLTIGALTFPQVLHIDWLKINTIFIGNTAQANKSAVLIAWKAVSAPRAIAPTPASLVITPADTEAFRRLGDVNRDGVIDKRDLDLIQAAFGSTKGMPKYNADYDLNGDGKIDVKDVYTAQQHFGLTIEQWKTKR